MSLQLYLAELNNNAIIAERPIVRETTAVLLMSCSCPLFYRSRANLYVHVRDTDWLFGWDVQFDWLFEELTANFVFLKFQRF